MYFNKTVKLVMEANRPIGDQFIDSLGSSQEKALAKYSNEELALYIAYNYALGYQDYNMFDFIELALEGHEGTSKWPRNKLVEWIMDIWENPNDKINKINIINMHNDIDNVLKKQGE